MYPGPVDEIVKSVWHQTWKYSDMEASATRSGPIAATPPMTTDQRAKTARRILGGSGEEIVNALGEIREAAGVPIEWVARSHFSDISYDRQVDIAGTIAAEVLPHAPAG
jgi:hypothetical protein